MKDAVAAMDIQIVLRIVLPLAFLLAALTLLVVMHADCRWAVSVGTGPFMRRTAAAMDAADALLERWYARVGGWMGSLIIALLLLLIAFVHVKGGFRMQHYGEEYGYLSMAPFDLGTPSLVRNRILAPLIGWLLHLRGPLFIWVPWLFLLGFLAMVNVWLRRAGASSLLAFAGMLAVAFSSVTLHSLVAPGFVDAVSYFLIGMAFTHIRRTFPSCLCMALALTAHEVAIFLVPAWLLASTSAATDWRPVLKRVAVLAGLLLPYAGYRWWVAQHDDTLLSVAFYFSPRNLLACREVGLLATAAGTFAVFRLHWVLLAVLLVMGGLRDKHLQWVLFLTATVCLSLFIAWDTTRMVCWAFPFMVIGVVVLGERVGQKRAAALLLLAWSLNFAIPPYTTTGAESYRLREIRDFLDAAAAAGEPIIDERNGMYEER
ncbi:MAG TPA: hypothetical protein PKJ19_00650 [Flavobacteriales bacterium]|nr:hypothetical protein [Flavobacteriales bacterium]